VLHIYIYMTLVA